MLKKHALNLWKHYQAPPADQQRQADYTDIFAPFQTIQELREELKSAKKGKTGRLTTIDELILLPDAQMEILRIIANLILAGEAPTLLKLGDVAPLPKDLRRARPVTCLDPIFKIVDAVIGRRLMRILQSNGLIADHIFGFIKGGAPDWPADIIATIQWHARRYNNTAFLFFLDATSAYDTVSHRGISAACFALGIPEHIQSTLLAHIHGHSRVVNTGYGLGDLKTAATLQGGVAQGANSSPYLFIVATLIAHLYSAEVLQGYHLPHPTAATNTTPTATPPPTQPTVAVHLVNYADDDAGANGGHAANKQQAQQMLKNTADGAEALTISLTIVGVRTQHKKSLFSYSQAAQHLLKTTPTIELTALDANGRLVRLPGTTVRSPGPAEGTTATDRGSTRYLGPCLSFAGDDKHRDVWREHTAACTRIVRQYEAQAGDVRPNFRVMRAAAASVLYQRLKQLLLVQPPTPDLARDIRTATARTGLEALGLAKLLDHNTDSTLVDILLLPTHLGGCGIIDPIHRAVQDAAANILAGLSHTNKHQEITWS